MSFSNWRYVYFVSPLEYLIQILPVPKKRVTVILTKLRSCNDLLRMLLLYEYISFYLKSVLIYKLLILDTYYLSLYLRGQGWENS
jgi:hypothetical protein